MLQPTHCCRLMLGIAMAPEAAGLPVRLLPLGRMISWLVGVPPLSVLAACPKRRRKLPPANDYAHMLPLRTPILPNSTSSISPETQNPRSIAQIFSI